MYVLSLIRFNIHCCELYSTSFSVPLVYQVQGPLLEAV